MHSVVYTLLQLHHSTSVSFLYWNGGKVRYPCMVCDRVERYYLLQRRCTLTHWMLQGWPEKIRSSVLINFHVGHMTHLGHKWVFARESMNQCLHRPCKLTLCIMRRAVGLFHSIPFICAGSWERLRRLEKWTLALSQLEKDSWKTHAMTSPTSRRLNLSATNLVADFSWLHGLVFVPLIYF